MTRVRVREEALKTKLQDTLSSHTELQHKSVLQILQELINQSHPNTFAIAKSRIAIYTPIIILLCLPTLPSSCRVLLTRGLCTTLKDKVECVEAALNLGRADNNNNKDLDNLRLEQYRVRSTSSSMSTPP